MKTKSIPLYVAAVLCFWLQTPAFAQDQIQSPTTTSDAPHQATTLTDLQQIIDNQQKALYEQQQQLDSQQEKLQQFRRQLKILSGNAEVSTVKVSTAPSRRNDLQTNRRDDGQTLDDWQGSFALGNTDTRFKVGGFLELDVIHDTNAILSKGQFINDTIVTRNPSKKDGADGQTNFSVSPSRLFLETRSMVDQRRVKTFLSIDMYADELSVDPQPRLRQGYVELSDILFGGDLLFGQAWSTTTDLESAPDLLDFRGVDNQFGTLLPQVRWTREIGTGVRLLLAAESPKNHLIEGADVITRLPDGVVALTWDSSTFNVMVSLLVTDLRASFNNGPIESAVGMGGSLSGKVKLPFGTTTNDVLFSLTYGSGVNSHYNNPHADAVYDASNNSLALIENYGVTLGYVHGWSEHLQSTFTYCCIEIDNHPAQTPESLQATEYSSGNLLWDVNAHWLLGVEGLWGKRKDNDEARATDFRTQFTSRYAF